MGPFFSSLLLCVHVTSLLGFYYKSFRVSLLLLTRWIDEHVHVIMSYHWHDFKSFARTHMLTGTD